MKCSENTGSGSQTLPQPCSLLPANKQLSITLLTAKLPARSHRDLLPRSSPQRRAGACTTSATDSAPGLETSRSDPHCHHLVTAAARPDRAGRAPGLAVDAGAGAATAARRRPWPVHGADPGRHRCRGSGGSRTLSPACPNLGRRVAKALMSPTKGKEGDKDSYCPLHVSTEQEHRQGRAAQQPQGSRA